MAPTAVVTCLPRSGGDVLLLRRSGEVGSYPGRRGAVAGYAEGDPAGAARDGCLAGPASGSGRTGRALPYHRSP